MKIYKLPTVSHWSFFSEENFDNLDPKIHGPRNYLQSFYLAALIQKCRGKTHYPFSEIRNGISIKRTRSSYNERMNNGTSLSYYDYETTPKVKKSFRKKSMPNLAYV